MTYYYVVRGVRRLRVGQLEPGLGDHRGRPGRAPPRRSTPTASRPAPGLADWTKGTFVAGGSTADWRGIQTCTAPDRNEDLPLRRHDLHHQLRQQPLHLRPAQGRDRHRGARRLDRRRGCTFGHRRRFESGYDGGTLAVSLNGTNYFFVPPRRSSPARTTTARWPPSCAPAGAAACRSSPASRPRFVRHDRRPRRGLQRRPPAAPGLRRPGACASASPRSATAR